jgi:hypothetical protein
MEDNMDPLIFTGLAVGLLFGFALQRGRFCMNSAFRDVIVMKDFTLLKAVGVAILVEMVGFAILALAGTINLNPKPLLWGANIVGGFVFGIGMVLAGGCASGITYRVGEGMVGAMSALVGFTLAGLMAAMGVLKPLVDSLQSTTKVMTADGKSLTLANVFGVPHYLAAFGIAIVVIGIWFVLARRNKADEDDFEVARPASLTQRIFKRGWGWLATGIVIGLIGIIAFPASAAAGRNYPLGITMGHVSVGKTLITGENALSWESMLVIGVIAGAAIAALIAGEFKLRAPSAGTLIQTFSGGLLMGFGAVLSSGCNIGHILSGVPQLSLGSILGGIFIILGGWTTGYLMFVRPHQAKSKTRATMSAPVAGR